MAAPGSLVGLKVRERAGGSQGCYGPFSETYTFTAKASPELKIQLAEPASFCLGDTVTYSAVFDTILPTQYEFTRIQFEPADAGQIIVLANSEVKVVWKKIGSCRLTVRGRALINPMCNTSDTAIFTVHAYSSPLQMYATGYKERYSCSESTLRLLETQTLAKMRTDTLQYGSLFKYGLWETDAIWTSDHLPEETGMDTLWSLLNQRSETPWLSVSILDSPAYDPVNQVLSPYLNIVSGSLAPGTCTYYFLRTQNSNGCIVEDRLKYVQHQI